MQVMGMQSAGEWATHRTAHSPITTTSDAGHDRTADGEALPSPAAGKSDMTTPARRQCTRFSRWTSE